VLDLVELPDVRQIGIITTIMTTGITIPMIDNVIDAFFRQFAFFVLRPSSASLACKARMKAIPPNR